MEYVSNMQMSYMAQTTGWSDYINTPNTNIHMPIGHILKHNQFLINYNSFLSNKVENLYIHLKHQFLGC